MTPREFQLLLTRYYIQQAQLDRRAGAVAYVTALVSGSRKKGSRPPKLEDFLPHTFHELVPQSERPRTKADVQTPEQQLAMAQFITRMAQSMSPNKAQATNGTPQ